MSKMPVLVIPSEFSSNLESTARYIAYGAHNRAEVRHLVDTMASQASRRRHYGRMRVVGGRQSLTSPQS